MQVYAWQLGVLFLGATVGCIAAGMVFLVWSAVVDDVTEGRGFGDNGKVCAKALDTSGRTTLIHTTGARWL